MMEKLEPMFIHMLKDKEVFVLSYKLREDEPKISVRITADEKECHQEHIDDKYPSGNFVNKLEQFETKKKDRGFDLSRIRWLMAFPLHFAISAKTALTSSSPTFAFT